MYKEVRVFVENKPGKLSKLSEVLGNANIDILAMDVADEGQFGVIKILTAKPEEAKAALSDAGMTVALNNVVCIELDDQPGGLLKFSRAIEKSGVNVTDAYGCILERHKRAVFVVKGDELDKIETSLRNENLKILDTLD